MGVRQVRPHWDKCPFESRDNIIIEEEDGTETKVIYHDCSIEDLDIPCPHPARYCHFKIECEEFEEMILMACQRDE